MDLQVARNGEVIGVCVFEELAALVAAGNILPTDYGLADGWPVWRSIADLIPPPPAPPPLPAWRQDPATEKQIEYLAAFGITAAPGLTKGEASDLIQNCKNDPAALKRKERIQRERYEREREEREQFPSYYLRQDITAAREEVEQAEGDLAECNDATEKPNLRDYLHDAKDELKRLIAERVEFWKWTFEEDNEGGDLCAMSYYQDYGNYFKKPTTKQVLGILDALDDASPDWDKTKPQAFYGTYEDNFPGCLKR